MKVKNFSGPLTSAGGVGPSDSLHPPVSVIYVAISFEYRCGFGERLQTLGAPFFDQHGGGPVYFVVYARTKSELLETLGLPGDVRLDHAIVSTVPFASPGAGTRSDSSTEPRSLSLFPKRSGSIRRPRLRRPGLLSKSQPLLSQFR